MPNNPENLPYDTEADTMQLSVAEIRDGQKNIVFSIPRKDGKLQHRPDEEVIEEFSFFRALWSRLTGEPVNNLPTEEDAEEAMREHARRKTA